MLIRLFVLLFIALPSLGFITLFGVEPDAYVAFYKEHVNDYSQSAMDGAVNYKVSYLPSELRVIKKFKGDGFDAEEAQLQLSEKDGLKEFTSN